MAFSLSFWSSSSASQCHSHCAQLRLCVLFLTLLSCSVRGWPFHAFDLCELVFLLNADIRLLFPFCMLPCTVFLLNAAVFADLALYLAVGGLASVELSCFLTTLVLQARLAPFPRLPIHGAVRALFLSSMPARDLQHITWRLRFRLSCSLLEVGHQQNLDLAASHRLGHLCFSWHVGSRCSLLRNFGLLRKLHRVEEVSKVSAFHTGHLPYQRLIH